MKLFPHQIKALELTADQNHVAYYMDMGLVKTHTCSEKGISMDEKIILVVCQKSKVQDWVDHFKTNYADKCLDVWDLTQKSYYEGFFTTVNELHLDHITNVAVISYDLVWRRPELKELKDFTLMLDESSLIQNEQAKRSKFILKIRCFTNAHFAECITGISWKHSGILWKVQMIG